MLIHFTGAKFERNTIQCKILMGGNFDEFDEF